MRTKSTQYAKMHTKGTQYTKMHTGDVERRTGSTQ